MNHKWYSRKMRECGVPEHLIGGLARYIVEGVPTGGCLHSILAHDLEDACERADALTLAGMSSIKEFLDDYAPAGCHGSYEKVELWVREGFASFPGKP